jgi:hypothetical protein
VPRTLVSAHALILRDMSLHSDNAGAMSAAASESRARPVRGLCAV